MDVLVSLWTTDTENSFDGRKLRVLPNQSIDASIYSWMRSATSIDSFYYQINTLSTLSQVAKQIVKSKTNFQ